MPIRPIDLVAATVLGVVLCMIAHDAKADQGNPLDHAVAAFCPPTAQTAWERAPQVWAGPRIEYANTLPNPQHGVIRYPTGGTGGSGGNSPEPEPPAPSPVPLPGAGWLLSGALGLFTAWRRWG